MTEGLRAEWTAHLCGLCLALRGEHGQFARTVTNYDGLLISVLTDAQTGVAAARRRTAGPCPLRGMRTASVARGEGARLAASVSLVLASAKVRDHIADGDGLLRRRAVASAARRVAAGWDRAGARAGGALGFRTDVLLEAVDRQADVERAAGPGTALTAVTEPTETATAAAFAHTAVLAGKPGNAAPLAEAGRLFGRLAHLLDAAEDRAADAAAGAWNPVTATGASRGETRRLCDDAVRGVRLALRDVEFADPRLAHALLVHELPRAVDRAFGTERCVHGGSAHNGRGGGGSSRHQGPEPGRGPGLPHGHPDAAPYGQAPPDLNKAGAPGADPRTARRRTGDPGGPDAPGGGDGWDDWSGGGGGGGGDSRGGGSGHRPGSRGLLAGCAAFLGVCCTCQMCCASEYEGPWSRKKREGACRDCCDACDCCSNCCDGCSCCEDGGCCDGCCCDCGA